MNVAADDPQAVRASLVSQNERKPATTFDLKDARGRSVKLSAYRGKVLLLNFWATWCEGCKTEIPRFQEFENTLGPRSFAALGVSLDEKGWAAVKPFLAKAGVTYRMVLAGKATPDDYAVTSLPATFIIDSQGRIAARYIGVVDRVNVENNLRAVLAER